MSGILAGKRAYVTGGSSGIGAGIVKTFAAEGARVAIGASRHADEARDMAKSLPAGSGNHIVVQADLYDRQQTERAAEDVVAGPRRTRHLRSFGGHRRHVARSDARNLRRALGPHDDLAPDGRLPAVEASYPGAAEEQESVHSVHRIGLRPASLGRAMSPTMWPRRACIISPAASPPTTPRPACAPMSSRPASSTRR